MNKAVRATLTEWGYDLDEYARLSRVDLTQKEILSRLIVHIHGLTEADYEALLYRDLNTRELWMLAVVGLDDTASFTTLIRRDISMPDVVRMAFDAAGIEWEQVEYMRAVGFSHPEILRMILSGDRLPDADVLWRWDDGEEFPGTFTRPDEAAQTPLGGPDFSEAVPANTLRVGHYINGEGEPTALLEDVPTQVSGGGEYLVDVTYDPPHHIGDAWGLLEESFAEQSDVWAYFEITPDGYWSDNGAVQDCVRLSTDDYTPRVAMATSMGSGDAQQVHITAGGSSSGPSSVALTPATKAHIWLHFVAEGTCYLYVSHSSTRPTGDGVGGVVLTNAGGAGVATKAVVNNLNTNLLTVHRILVSTTEIGDNP